METFSLAEQYDGSIWKVISVEFPRIVSEFLIDKICESLNMAFPKLFYSFEIKEKSLDIIVPNVNTKRPILLYKVQTWDPEVLYPVCVYDIVLPFSLKMYLIWYKPDENRIVNAQENFNDVVINQLVKDYPKIF